MVKKLTKEELAKELEKFSLSPLLDVESVSISSVSGDNLTYEAKECVSDKSEIEHNQHIEEEGKIDQVPLLDPVYVNDTKYAGDLIDNSGPPDNKFEALEIGTATIMISFFMDDIKSGEVKLHDWQKDILDELSLVKPTAKDPYEYHLCACNGSGKDAFIVAPWVVFFCATKIKSRTIITSSSGTQLTAQTESYIKALCTKINEYFTANFGGPLFKINQRFIKGIRSGSEIRLFATDEEGKAEGYHPIEPGREMCIVVNEAKSVTSEIYRALGRCTGFNYWLDISSPGQPLGDFYERFTSGSHKLRVDYTLCPHHSDKQRQKDLQLLGEDNAYYRSKWLALFTSLDSNSVIPHELVERVKRFTREGRIPHLKLKHPLRVGIDLAAGGAENAIISIKDNGIYKKLFFIEKDTTVTAMRIDSFLSHNLELPKDHDFIFADDGGVGKAIIDMLCTTYGWKIRRVRNQSPASDTKMFSNMGAQNWYSAKPIFESNVFRLLDDDDLLYKQLSNRYCKQDGNQGRLALESKQYAIAHGRPSPDRADALILALKGAKPEDFTGGEIDETTNRDIKPKVYIQKTEEAVNAFFDKMNTDEYEGKQLYVSTGNRKRSFGSINTILGKANRNKIKL